MGLRTHRTGEVVRRRPINQGLDDDLSLCRIVGSSSLAQKHEPRGSVRGRVSEHDREERHELTRCIVAIHLVLGDSQPQEEVSTFLEAVRIEGDFLQSPDQVATHVTPDFGQISELPKRMPNPFSHEGSINLRQGREDLRVMRPHEAFDAVKRPPVAANVSDDLTSDVSRIEESKLLCRTHLEIGTCVPSQNCIPRSPTPVPPLAFGQMQGNRAGLQGDEATSALGDPTVDQLVETNTEISG